MRVFVGFIFLTVFSIVLFLSCNKQHEDSTFTSSEPISKDFQPCDCSSSGKNGPDEYIRADLGGSTVCFDVMPSVPDTFANFLKWGYLISDTGRQYYDNLYMIRNASNGKWMAAIYLSNTHALTKTYPYELPRFNPEYCETGDMEIDLLFHDVGCLICPENQYNYFAQ